MPTVVSDAGPIRYLIEIGHVDAIQKLFGRIIVPHVVRDELLHQNSPTRFQFTTVLAQGWMDLQGFASAPSLLRGLDPGESAALQIAVEIKADMILMDDRAGRNFARSLGIPTIGTLAILEEAASQDLLK